MQPRDQDEGMLLKRARQGDEDAFTDLYSMFYPRIFRYVLQMCGSSSSTEDILQEVFLVFLQKIESFDEDRASISSYLYGIARNFVMRWLQQYNQEVAITEKTEEPLAEKTGENPLADLSREESIAWLRSAILTLPASYREVIVLCELQEHSYREAAVVIGCAVGTVRSRLSRARELLLRKFQAASQVRDSQKKSGGVSYELSAI
jgi:RNA polymerase sigma factor (sigma-70 family)